MFIKRLAPVVAVVLSAAMAVPAGAQGFSESYKFLKAVKDGDGTEVDSMLSTPGPLVNTKDRETGDTALHYVARDRNATWIRFLVGKGARVDAQNNAGDTPLTIATQIGWLEGVQTLLGLRANVNQSNGKGETPIILAVQRRDLPLVQVLMRSGADPKKSDRVAGLSALDYAKRDARSAAILRALEAPARPDRPVAGPSL